MYIKVSKQASCSVDIMHNSLFQHCNRIICEKFNGMSSKGEALSEKLVKIVEDDIIVFSYDKTVKFDKISQVNIPMLS
jgi:hypothetical protein